MNKGKTNKKTSTIEEIMQWEMEKNPPMIPPLDNFQGKNENCSSLARTIGASRRSFLQTWPFLSGTLD